MSLTVFQIPLMEKEASRKSMYMAALSLCQVQVKAESKKRHRNLTDIPLTLLAERRDFRM